MWVNLHYIGSFGMRQKSPLKFCACDIMDSLNINMHYELTARILVTTCAFPSLIKCYGSKARNSFCVFVFVTPLLHLFAKGKLFAIKIFQTLLSKLFQRTINFLDNFRTKWGLVSAKCTYIPSLIEIHLLIYTK